MRAAIKHLKKDPVLGPIITRHGKFAMNYGEPVFEYLPEMADDEVIEHLTQVKGIGVWTAHMFLIFALRRPDILPTGDLGIRTAIQKAWNLPELPKPLE